MNRHSVIRQAALYCVLAVALLCPIPAVADLCTDAGLPVTVNATFLGFATTPGGNLYSTFPTCTTSKPTSCTYIVNSLAASGFGTLADAVSQSNRYIVFDSKLTGTTITSRTGIMVKGAYLTIDGCSAPKPGITLTGAGLYIHGSSDPYPVCTDPSGNHIGCDVHDIIVRNIRARKTTNDGSSSDGFRVAYSAYNIVFDHVSADYSGDGNIDITQLSYNMTISWSIFSHPKSTHNSLLAYQPSYLTMHHNIFMKSTDRNPFSGYDYNGAWPDPCYCPANTTCDAQCLHPTADPSLAETTLDFWNNLIWDWGGGRGSILWYHSQSNVLNNYYNAPGRKGDNPDSLIVCSPAVPAAHVGDCNNYAPSLYAWGHVEGNINPDWPTINDVGAGQVPTSFYGQPPSDSACDAAKKGNSPAPRVIVGIPKEREV